MKSTRSSPWPYFAALSVILTGVWLAWSGHYTPLLVSLGVLSSLFVAGMMARMHILDAESVPLWLGWRLAWYLPWLFWEIGKSNVDVALRILTPGPPIRPNVIRVKASQTTDTTRTIYANSITLTPGTVSIVVEGDVITVHALTEEAAAGVETGEMDRRVTAIEGRR